ncbi:hypothetical protein ACRAWC_22640 [Leifsonia sp. L25]|uniref:hypothetical protein n=1 Tax=Leifsonia sp. L25 TaxID=3423957 RepID=UPI003D693CCE
MRRTAGREGRRPDRPLHLLGWIDLPIVELAEREFGVPAVLENDATAGALGEFPATAPRATRTPWCT